MSVETFSVEQSITVTEAAQEHFRRQLLSGGADGVRLSVKESGCTGYKYVVDLVEAGRDGDLAMELDNGVRLFISRDALKLVSGTRIDFQREGLNQSLTFHNPNVTDECGCGESFNVG